MKVLICLLAACLVSVGWAKPALIDGRPYEFVWANRTVDDRPVLLPLTDTEGWTVTTTNAVATFAKTTEHRLFGDGVTRLTYRSAGGKGAPAITLRPPAPVPVQSGVDTVSVWVWGNRVSYARDASTPPVTISALFTDAAGRPFTIHLYTVSHLEWFLVQKRLTREQSARLAQGGHFTGFTISGGTNPKDRAIEFTSLAVYREELKPLTFKPRARRPNRVFPDAPAGVNTGDGELPFPNRRDGVVPYPVAAQVEYRLPTSNVNWDDLAVKGPDGRWRRFAVGGGVWTATAKGVERIPRDDVKVTWRVEGQSLIADVRGPADIADVRFGALADFPGAEAFIVPYWSYSMTGGENRPHVTRVDFGGTPFFCAATMDWTQSNGSEPWCEAETFEGWAQPHGGVRYNVKTDGTRNPVFERFVWSFAPEFADVLPVIPNPPSPYRGLTADYEWCHMSAQKNRQKDKDYWRDRKRRRLDKVFIGDHEMCMRDGNESFTFRTRTAPGKGGDPGTLDFTRYMIDELGYLYGPYNNYTDFATVNEHWHADHVTRASDGSLVTAWNRCYAPKPAWSVEMCERIVPVLQGKFKFNSGYCDVHTCVTPWGRCDYDARVPGAGTFASTFYAYGELLTLQRKFWEGPVYSEGGVHFMYCGLVDGNFAQDQGARLDVSPWLVDFDLLRLHPLANNFGMGYPRMFYRGDDFAKRVPGWAERFYAATLAFGHVGYFMTGKPDLEEQGYWLVQPVAVRYAKADVREIRYADAKGTFVPTSAALASGAYKRSQVRVTYADGTRVTANGSATGEWLVLPWKGGVLPLPANGWIATTGDGKVCSIGGGRADACVGDAAVYLDGRGTWFNTAFGATDGRLIRVFNADNTEEVFIRHTREVELPYAATAVRLLDKSGLDIGPAAFTNMAGRTRLRADVRACSYLATRPAGWTEPAALSVADAFVRPADFVPPVAAQQVMPTFELPKRFVRGVAFRGKAEEVLDPASGAAAQRSRAVVGGESKEGFYMHPPYRGGVGYTFMRWSLELPKEPLFFKVDIGKVDRSSTGDGTLYRIFVEDMDGKRTLLAEKQTNAHRWQTLAADLAPWAGRRVRLLLVSDVGPANNTFGDHSSWCDLRFEKK